MSYQINWRTHVISVIIMILLIIPIYGLVKDLTLLLYTSNLVLYPTYNINFNAVIFLCLLMIPVTLAHEIIHIFAYRIFGCKAKIGFKALYAYTQETSKKPITRTQYLIVLLAPVVTISVLSALIPHWVAGFVFLLNLIGSAGDMAIALYLCRHSSNSRIVGNDKGFNVIN